ncbi:energy coupling factor transporter S component ThiW [Salimicrobium flavidum]|uniref:Energy coupling factor transporter S component ThiW n=1 Tax=Salimicrobium flavidum TaxID=570947 RepID=A0A1N7J816_9BACI|nr:energy coupling factor transporter S component ThiW [Salimicrobium flavidum]SIS45376.1 energy coupling factor transporter S component ThiW [Salimicrobium flavidum]
MNRTKMLTTMAVLTALGTLGAQMLWFPAGVAKAYPVQHAVNVVAAVSLGPVPAVTIAFLIGVLRNLLGLGTLLAFPGGMVGALFAGISYHFTKRVGGAVTGEIIGTGLFGSLASVPIANILMGSEAGVFAFVPSFIVSTVTGALIGWMVSVRLKQTSIVTNV